MGEEGSDGYGRFEFDAETMRATVAGKKNLKEHKQVLGLTPITKGMEPTKTPNQSYSQVPAQTRLKDKLATNLIKN